MTPVRDVNESDEALLASLGYKQEFKRAFRPFEIFGLALGVFGLIPSIATVLSSTVSNGGAVSMVWGWTFASFFVLCIAISIAELASSAPTVGGLYYITYMLSSPRYRNILCWIVGYASTVGWIAAIASVAWGCTLQITAAANIGTNGRIVTTTAKSYGIYVGIILSQGVICSLGTKVFARLQVVYMTINVLLPLVVIIALPIATPKELMNPPSYVFSNFTNFSGWPDVFAFVLSLLTPLWTVNGFDSVIHISEESSNVATAAPWGIVGAVTVALVLGWAVNVSLAFCMGSDLSYVLDSSVNQPIIQIFLNSFGQLWALVVWSFVILVQFIGGSSILLVASRQSFAFARDGALPFSKVLYRINAYTGTPVNTVWFDCVFALLIGLLAFAGQAAVSAAFTITVTGLYVAYIVPITSKLIFRSNLKPGPFSLGVLSAPIGVISVVFMVFILVILSFPSSPHPEATSMNYTSAVLGGVMLFAAIRYYFPVYGAVHWFNGPTFNIEEKTGRVGQEESIREIMEEKKHADR